MIQAYHRIVGSLAFRLLAFRLLQPSEYLTGEGPVLFKRFAKLEGVG